jgi:hypothetical protein
MCLCNFYKLPYNAGVLTTLRFSLPSLRVSGSFHDDDMLALVELLLRHANTRLKFITRLDFTIASKEGTRSNSGFDKSGFTSHGALTLAKLLQTTKYISQVWLPRHRIGPYGASALFWACRDNPTITTLHLRRCRIGERGAFAFCEMIASSPSSPSNKNGGGGLEDVDLSNNGIGNRGTVAIERALERRNQERLKNKTTDVPLFVNLEGNLVIPEVRTTTVAVLCCVAGCNIWYRIGGILHPTNSNELYCFFLLILDCQWHYPWPRRRLECDWGLSLVPSRRGLVPHPLRELCHLHYQSFEFVPEFDLVSFLLLLAKYQIRLSSL